MATNPVFTWIGSYLFHLPYWGVLIALIGTMGFGALWYGEKLFGNQWADAQGIDDKKREELGKTAMDSHKLSALMYLVMIIVVSYLSDETNCKTINDGLWLGGLLWFGFNLPLAVVQHSYNPHSNKVVLLIDLCYQMCVMLLQGVIVIHFKQASFPDFTALWDYNVADDNVADDNIAQNEE